MEPAPGLLSVAAVTLRTRAVFNLPSEYNFVYVEIRVEGIRKLWTTQKVPVVDGAALVDFWARIPGTGGETHIDLKVCSLEDLHGCYLGMHALAWSIGGGCQSSMSAHVSH